ncbi:type II secretion system F family protein [Alkalimonas amylolytica]|uniref:General secretion pathway protein F n=1 Tax=Alkalimonas amylolytica TaxID=152573 RepID=A0A1H4A155_ALKAM|nr:type II secretion system F family protein [Alkalimonas amylolytica]SEA29725.1 general secretion pathway protein F [Alkalimonas amylolytica]
MQRFVYTAYNRSGVKQQGTLEAASETEARQRLLDDQLLIAELSLQQSSAGAPLLGGSRLSTQDIEFFTSELALLLRSGLKLDKGLAILRHNVQKPALRDLLNRLLQKLKQGEQLSAALDGEPGFSSLYVGLVKIAEETGDLTGVFERLSGELKYQLELSGKIKQALVYPSVILVVCLLALAFIFNFVIPNLSSMFREGQELPGYTQALLAITHFMQSYQWYLLAVLLLGGYLLWQQRQSPWVQQLLEGLREKAPVFASANLLVERIRFNAALGTMLASGVAIDRALRFACQTLRTRSLQYEVQSAQEQIRRGNGLAKSLSETRLYPPYYAALLAIGEESGALAGVFQEIADRSRKVFYEWVTRFTNLLEPLLIMFMGLVVGSIVVVMMLSITAVTDMPL